MPNWVDNNLFVTGEPDQLEAFDKAFHGHTPLYDGEVEAEETYSFSTIVPVPPEVLAMPYSPHHLPGETMEDRREQVCGYNWQIKNWGVKWDVRMNDVQKNEDSYFYCFDTPWSIPLEWYLAASAKFPDLEFETDCYEESGMFNAKLIFRAGVLVSQEDLPNPWEDIERLGAEGTA